MIAAQGRLLSVRRLEVVGRVQRRVAEEFPRAAVDLIHAAPVRHVHRRAGGAAVLRALVVRDDAELADRVGRRLHHLVRKALVARAVRVVVDAVDQEVVERAAQAVDVEGAFARRPVRALVQRRLADAGRQQGERRVLAAVQRELAHLVAGDHLAPLARVGFDERQRRGDDDPLRQLPDRHRQIDAHARRDLHLNVVHERDGEAALLGRDDVDAGLHRDELVPAVLAGGARDRHAGLGIGQGDFCVRHRGAGTVFHRSNDGRGVELSPSTGNFKAQQNGQDQQTCPAPKRSHLSPPGSTFRAERTSYRRPVTSWRRPNNSISPKGEVTRNLRECNAGEASGFYPSGILTA